MTMERGEGGTMVPTSCVLRPVSVLPPPSVCPPVSNCQLAFCSHGCREKVDPDNIFPYDVPINFGDESQPLEVCGESCGVCRSIKDRLPLSTTTTVH